jgi:NADH dehydrogenase/NADH:ubiquinone oxidoreductase subunit G
MATITINGDKYEVEAGSTILEAALENKVYIPNLCYHPNVSSAVGMKPIHEIFRGKEKFESGNDEPYEGCGLCVVEVTGGEIVKACHQKVENGMEIVTETDQLTSLRQKALIKIFSHHPHVCITCEYREGCDRIQCTFGNPVEERCCDLFPKCELRFIAEYVGLSSDTPKYTFEDLPVVEETLYRWNFNLCVNCTRCVRGCREVREATALGFIMQDDALVGRTGPTDKESGCKFCGVCVEICPTGVVRDIKKPPRNKWRDSVQDKMLAPTKSLFELIKENLATVPEAPGVYRLYDENQELIYIKGTPDLKQDLMEEEEIREEAKFFDYEEYEMYTMRESELIQEYLQRHGRMPPLNDELDDLF